MKKHNIPLMPLLFMLPWLVIASHNEPPWKVWKSNSELAVSYRPAIALNKKLSTKLIEIKATATVNSTLAGFLLFLQHVDNTPNWLANVSTSKIIQQISTSETIFFIKFLSVWPLKPRVLVLQSTYWQNDDLSVEIALSDEGTITDTKITTLLGEDIQHFLRIKTYQAHWKITPQKSNTVEKAQHVMLPQLLIEYTFVADGSGDTPKWLAEHFALKSIWQSMRNIKQQLPRSQWQNKTIDGITEANVTEANFTEPNRPL
jgi:hypothetical protein